MKRLSLSLFLAVGLLFNTSGISMVSDLLAEDEAYRREPNGRKLDGDGIRRVLTGNTVELTLLEQNNGIIVQYYRDDGNFYFLLPGTLYRATWYVSDDSLCQVSRTSRPSCYDLLYNSNYLEAWQNNLLGGRQKKYLMKIYKGDTLGLAKVGDERFRQLDEAKLQEALKDLGAAMVTNELLKLAFGIDLWPDASEVVGGALKSELLRQQKIPPPVYPGK